MHIRRMYEPLQIHVRQRARGLALVLSLLLAGCMTSHPLRLDEWDGAQNCHFAHVTKQQFESALRRVFDVSLPKVYGLRPEEGGAMVEKHWAMDVVFASATGGERWRLEYAPAGDGVDAHAEVTHNSSKAPLLKRIETPRSTDAADYQLLWSRVAYVLGSRAEWPRCESPPNAGGAGLCGNVHAPPLRLAGSR